jgi:hypothetical protein
MRSVRHLGKPCLTEDAPAMRRGLTRCTSILSWTASLCQS